MSFSLADIKRADVQSFRDVASALDGMAAANSDMKSGVGRLPIAGDAWKGVSGDAAHHELDGFGRLLEGSAEAKKGAAAKIRRAADEFEGVKQLLTKIEQDAAKGKFKIDMSTGKVTPPSGDYDKSELDYLTNTLKQIQAAGDTANADLAAAVKAAKELPDPSSAAAQALPTTPTSTVKPPGGAFGGVDNLVAPKPDGDPGATKAAAAGADTQANYKEWYPKTAAPAGDKLTMDPSKAGSLTGSMGAMEKNRPPDAPYKPAFGEGVGRQFAKGVNERVDQMVESAKDHSGLGGWEKFKESWTGTAEGLQHETMRQLFPGVAMAEDAKSMIDQAATSYQHPETIPENLGKTTADVAAIGATAPLGGEGALSRLGMEDAAVASRGGLHDLPGGHLFDAPPHPHADVPSGGHGDAPGPLGGDHSGGIGDHGGAPGGHGMPGGNPAPFDFGNPLETARPEFNIPNPVEVMSPELRGLVDQHLTGSGETVIGPYAPKGGGPSYIDVAQQRGASYFDIGEAWNSSTPTQQLASNQYALDMAVKNGDTIRMSVPFYRVDPSTFTGAEIRYFESHGYQRMGDNLLIPPTGGTP